MGRAADRLGELSDFHMNLTPSEGEREGRLGGSITDDVLSKESSARLSGVMCLREWVVIVSLPHSVIGWVQHRRNLVEVSGRVLGESCSLWLKMCEVHLHGHHIFCSFFFTCLFGRYILGT